jgi:hypothetical protein
MNMVMVKSNNQGALSTPDVPLYHAQSESRIVMELDNVSHGLKYFSKQFVHTKAVQALLSSMIQFKTWSLNKPTIQTLTEQYIAEVEQAQAHYHLDPGTHAEAIVSLSEQLMFLSSVFEQESSLVEQMVFEERNLFLVD